MKPLPTQVCSTTVFNKPSAKETVGQIERSQHLQSKTYQFSSYEARGCKFAGSLSE